ncbi:MAG: alpha/beta hydrolase [Deltaproteobacteria bacterium]|nr:alpha/beta hydrolase [Deltaproteobacteria bacterium]
MRVETERKMKRWWDNRWILDQIIQANGLDWDRVRTAILIRNCGPGVVREVTEISQKIQKFKDIPREFHRAAQRREELAIKADQEGHGEFARVHYYIACLYYVYAVWGIFEDGNPKRIAWQERIRACYDAYIRLADHPIERVELPFEDKSIAALLHLPPGTKPGERLPGVISVQGMDSVKEEIALYGEPFRDRRIVLLSVDPPGRGESRLRGLKFTASNCEQMGKAACDYLCSRSEIDGDRLALFGWSMGSYWGTRIAATEPRIKACAVGAPCFEPGFHTLFSRACPTFKMNAMHMAGYDDEGAFDEFAKSFSLIGVASKVSCPYLVVTGEEDELCPLEFIEQRFDEVRSPKKLVVFEGERHSIPLYPQLRTTMADWLKDRLEGKPFDSEKVFVEVDGSEVKVGL